jgi:hypothetical protein
MSACVVEFSSKDAWDAAYDALLVRRTELQKDMARHHLVQTLVRHADDALGNLRGFAHPAAMHKLAAQAFTNEQLWQISAALAVRMTAGHLSEKERMAAIGAHDIVHLAVQVRA